MENFDWTISRKVQYNNSKTLNAILEGLNTMIKFSPEAFLDGVLNIDTAVGTQLDTIGSLLGASRIITFPDVLDDENLDFGFDDNEWGGFDEFGGTFDVKPPSTTTLKLEDNAYRTYIKFKAYANVSNCSLYSINYMLGRIFEGRGNCYVMQTGETELFFIFDFALLPFERNLIVNRYIPILAGYSLLFQDTQTDWKGKPADWSDIRTDCPANSIALYAGHTADYSQYDNLGFTASCVGGYKVYIDGTQYGSTYASGSNCTITWSSLALTTGDDITTPSALKAHKIWITPATEGRNITRFASARVSTGSENEYQGKLWIHFNLSNTIQVSNLLRASGTYSINGICKAITAKNNTLNCHPRIGSMCQDGISLEYLPVLVGTGIADSGSGAFNGCQILKSITLKNFKFTTITYGFNNCYNLETIKNFNVEVLNSAVNGTINSAYNDCRKLRNILPETYTSNITRAQNYIHNAPELKDIALDLRGATSLTELGIFSTNSSYFATGIKGVRVSNEAPFNRATTTQIDVRYTNLDRTALVQLFQDLPTVSSGQIINIVGCTGVSDLTADDEAIATAKGWTITK